MIFKNTKSILLFNVVLAILLGTIINVRLPEVGRYTINKVDEHDIISNQIYVYEDIYNDGISEELVFLTDYHGFPSVYLNDFGKTPFQWNLRGKYCGGQFYAFEDITGDNAMEILTFTYSEDSIFLNAFDTKNETPLIENLFISTYQTYNEREDFILLESRFADLNDDNSKELIFVISCDFSLSTRFICSVDFKSQEVTLSPKAGSTYTSGLTVHDIDGDGRCEIMGELHSPGNCNLNYPYSDRFSWFQIYNSDLEFKFEPFKTGYWPARFTVLPLEVENRKFLTGYYNHYGNKDSSYVALYNLKGQLIRKHHLPTGNNYVHANSLIEKLPCGKWLLAFNNGEIFEIDTLLHLKKRKEIHPFVTLTNLQLDADGDGDLERFLRGEDGSELIIADWDFKHSTKMAFKFGAHAHYFSVQYMEQEKPYIAISTFENLYKYQYSKNIWYHLKWPFRILSYILIYTIAWTISYFQKRILLQKVKSEKRIASLQIKSISNQFNPHFTLNILNSISALYGLDRKEEADQAMCRYSKLLRYGLITVNEISVPLELEIDFIQDYLELEKVRLNGRLAYSIHIDKNVPQTISVPKMMLHTFVENSIKHGLSNLPENHQGFLNIQMIVEKKYLQIQIDDNGIGREEAKKYQKNSTGLGLKILDEMLDLYITLENKKIHYAIRDSQRYATGTSIQVNLSLN